MNIAAAKHDPKQVGLNEGNQKIRKMISVLLSLLTRVLWLFLVMIWPILRRVLVIDITFLFLRMSANIARHGPYFDWIFWSHFVLYVALICIIIPHKSR